MPDDTNAKRDLAAASNATPAPIALETGAEPLSAPVSVAPVPPIVSETAAAASGTPPPEATIISEQIISVPKPAERKKTSVAGTFKPLPSIPRMATPKKTLSTPATVASTVPPVSPSESLPVSASLSTPVATVTTTSDSRQTEIATVPTTPSTALEFETSAPVVTNQTAPARRTPAPAAPPQQPPAPRPVQYDALPVPENSGENSLRTEMAALLKSVKLPERPDYRASGDKPRGIPLAQKQVPRAAPASEGTPFQRAPIARDTTTEANTETESTVRAIHTLRQDMQHVVSDGKMTLVHAAALEQDSRRTRITEQPHQTPGAASRNRRTIGMLLVIFLLLFLGAAALFGVYYVITQQQAAPVQHAGGPSLIFAEQEVALPLDGASPAALKNTLAQARNAQSGALGSITRVVPLVVTTASDGTASTRSATFSEFMTAIGITLPDELKRSLSENFFFGFHTIDKTSPVMVIPVDSYDHAFAGMLSWEPHMNADLAPVFTFIPALASDSNGIPQVRTFSDIVLRNYDVRALKDDSGTVLLYYSFPTPHLLVIAESPYTFTEILSRLQASRAL